MSEQTEKKNAPWWVYLAVVIAANLGRQQLMPADTSFLVNAGSTLATIAVAIVVVTVVYRAMAGRSGG